MMFLYILSVSIAVRTLITFYEIPSSALAPELAPDYDDRTRIASFRYFFGVAGGLGMAFAGLYIFLAPTPEFPVGQLNPDGYRAFAITGAIVMASSILVSALGTHHRIPWLSKGTAAPWGGLAGHLRHMKTAYSHKGFHAILGFGLLKFTMIGLASALALYIGTYYWRLGSQELAILALDGILSAFVAIWLAPRISLRLGKRNGAILLSFCVILFGALPYLLSLNGMFVPLGSPWLVPALFTIQFFYSLSGTTSMVLVHAMIADVVEEQELKTGHRSEGLFYSAHSFLQKCVSGLGVFLAGLMITAVGLPERANPATLDPSIPRNLILLYVPIFAVATALAAMMLRSYRIDRTSHEATLARLAAMKAPAAAE
jgi:Na+/melibiose symporter-like transporter